MKPNGAVSQQLALTPAQKTAIHNAVMEQHRGTPAQPALTLSVGAAVPTSVELRDLPERAAIDMPWTDTPWTNTLKYAVVENDVVVVDRLRMRVVDIIHRGRP